MRNIITLYELMGLIKDDKAPKNIKHDDVTFKYERRYKDYFDFEGISLFSKDYVSDITTHLDDTVEILPKENEMKEMVYQKDRKTEVLYSGTYKCYDFYIMNLGTHPTAYVDVSNNKLLNGKYYGKIDIDVHFGLTYSADHLVTDTGLIIGWFIGWDYAHCCDYSGLFPNELQTQKKWTTKEIFEDVKSVIEQCINYKEDNNDEWKEIEELGMVYNGNDDEEIMRNRYIINQLIKNQKYLKEKLEDNTYFKSKVEFTGYIDEYLKGKLGNKNENL